MEESPRKRRDAGPIPVAAPSDLVLAYLEETGQLDANGSESEPKGTPEMRALKAQFRRVLKTAQQLKDPGDRDAMMKEVRRLRGSLAANIGDPWTEAE